MNQAELIAAIRKGIREPAPKLVSNTNITDSIAKAVNIMGDLLMKASPETFTTLKSITSYTNRFSLPSDCKELLSVWDLGDEAFTITGATNASPIVITATGHELADDDIVIAHDVAGNTAANGTFKVDNADTTLETLELYGSTGNGAYTSGGKIFKKSEDWIKLDRIPSKERLINQDDKYFLDGSYIEVDDPNFENDLVILYRWKPDDITEISADFHYGIVAFCVLDVLELPGDKEPNYQDLKKSYDWHEKLWNKCEAELIAYSPIVEDAKMTNISRVKGFI